MRNLRARKNAKGAMFLSVPFEQRDKRLEVALILNDIETVTSIHLDESTGTKPRKT